MPKKRWYQEVLDVDRLHESMVSQLGEANAGRPFKSRGKEGWSTADTAKHFGVSQPYIAMCLRLAAAFRKHPEIMSVPTKAKALILLKQFPCLKEKEDADGAIG